MSLVIKDLFKTYPSGVQALRGISFALEKNETLAVVGESGCGKSTLARHLLKLENKTSGDIQLEGRDLAAYSHQELAGLIQMVFQDPAQSLNPRRRIFEIIAEPLRVKGGYKEKEIRSLVTKLAQDVGLREDMLFRYPHMMSGGQKQRVGIARALITGAKYIICDEPVSALDVSVQAQVLNLLLDLKKARGLSYLFITHDLSVVRFLADRVIVMEAGQIVEAAPTEQIFNSPKHEYTKTLLNSIPKAFAGDEVVEV